MNQLHCASFQTRQQPSYGFIDVFCSMKIKSYLIYDKKVKKKNPGYSDKEPQKLSGKGNSRALHFPNNHHMYGFIFLQQVLQVSEAS